MTLDRGDFFPFASSAVKGHFFEFLVSNILVTSLSRISGAALANGTHFPAHTAILSARDFSECGVARLAAVLLHILGLQRSPRV